MNGQQEVSDTRLFVKNIPPEWDEWSVFHAFKKYGVVNLVQLPPSKPGFQFRFGFVEMLNEKGAKAALAAAGRQHSLTMDNLTCPLHIEACLLHNPRKGDNIRPLGEQNRLTTDDQQQRARQPSGPRGNGSSPTNGDAVRHGQPPPRRSPVSGSEQKRFVEHSWQPKKKSPNGKRVARFDHEAIFFEPSIHRHADFRLNVATQVTIPISAVKSPSDFYAIADDSAAERRQLQENMAEHYKGAKVGLAGVQ
uniref:RRM domain-containing protein n=1 Tax=Plectus sambesii TaxID=2011161 RepID=A0A914XLF6_9BILA